MPEDRYVRCENCGIRFVWTILEQDGEEIPPDCCPACRILAPAPGRKRGVVKFYNSRKGWGFITQVDGREVFFHRSGLDRDCGLLAEGDLVEFALQGTDRGPQAIAVKHLDAEQKME